MTVKEFETTKIWLRSMLNINKELDFEREKVNQSIERIEKLEKEKEKLFNILDKITNPTYKQVLNKRYVQGKRWEDIERELNYAEQHIHRLHNQAIIEVHKIKTGQK